MPETGDGDERERQQPDEEPVRERARHDAAADLGVVVDHLEQRVDGAMTGSLRLGSLREPLPARLCFGPFPHTPVSARTASARPSAESGCLSSRGATALLPVRALMLAPATSVPEHRVDLYPPSVVTSVAEPMREPDDAGAG